MSLLLQKFAMPQALDRRTGRRGRMHPTMNCVPFPYQLNDATAIEVHLHEDACSSHPFHRLPPLLEHRQSCLLSWDLDRRISCWTRMPSLRQQPGSHLGGGEQLLPVHQQRHPAWDPHRGAAGVHAVGIDPFGGGGGRAAKCPRFDGHISVKILAGWGKSRENRQFCKIKPL